MPDSERGGENEKGDESAAGNQGNVKRVGRAFRPNGVIACNNPILDDALLPKGKHCNYDSTRQPVRGTYTTIAVFHCYVVGLR